MFSRLFKKGDANKTPAGAEGSGNNSDTAAAEQPAKKSLYRRFQDAKRGELSEADILKYTGKSKGEIREWGKNRPGVAGNQAAGKLDMGATTGFGGVAAAEGFGGWGTNANAPLKYPPKQPETKPVDDKSKVL